LHYLAKRWRLAQWAQNFGKKMKKGCGRMLVSVLARGILAMSADRVREEQGERRGLAPP
jgi:hypothetical protein